MALCTIPRPLVDRVRQPQSFKGVALARRLHQLLRTPEDRWVPPTDLFLPVTEVGPQPVWDGDTLERAPRETFRPGNLLIPSPGIRTILCSLSYPNKPDASVHRRNINPDLLCPMLKEFQKPSERFAPAHKIYEHLRTRTRCDLVRRKMLCRQLPPHDMQPPYVCARKFIDRYPSHREVKEHRAITQGRHAQPHSESSTMLSRDRRQHDLPSVNARLEEHHEQLSQVIKEAGVILGSFALEKRAELLPSSKVPAKRKLSHG